MKSQIRKELHAKQITELSKQLKEEKVALAGLMLDKEMGKLKNTSSLAGKRREIAILSTIIKEKSVAAKIAADKGGKNE